jgi:hypothetical protein
LRVILLYTYKEGHRGHIHTILEDSLCQPQPPRRHHQRSPPDKMSTTMLQPSSTSRWCWLHSSRTSFNQPHVEAPHQTIYHPRNTTRRRRRR